MVETFRFRTETKEKTYHHTVHSVDVKTAVEKWLHQIDDLVDRVYSFSSEQVQDIKKQYSNGQLKIHVDRVPYFLTYQSGDKHQVVYIDKENKHEPDFLAILTYLATQQGGRKGYAASGFRPHVKFDGIKELTSGEQIFIDKDKVFPGETVTAEIRILRKELFKNYLFVGQHFEFAEASHIIGHGEIIQIINPDLRQACR